MKRFYFEDMFNRTIILWSDDYNGKSEDEAYKVNDEVDDYVLFKREKVNVYTRRCYSWGEYDMLYIIGNTIWTYYKKSKDKNNFTIKTIPISEFEKYYLEWTIGLITTECYPIYIMHDHKYYYKYSKAYGGFRNMEARELDLGSYLSYYQLDLRDVNTPVEDRYINKVKIKWSPQNRTKRKSIPEKFYFEDILADIVVILPNEIIYGKRVGGVFEDESEDSPGFIENLEKKWFEVEWHVSYNENVKGMYSILHSIMVFAIFVHLHKYGWKKWFRACKALNYDDELIEQIKEMNLFGFKTGDISLSAIENLFLKILEDLKYNEGYEGFKYGQNKDKLLYEYEMINLDRV